ncbi:MAG: ATP-binding protein [Anaerolineales bacterium]
MSKRVLLALTAAANTEAKEALASAGYAVSEARNKEELRAALREGRLPDIILFEDVFQDVDSLQFAQELKKKYPAIPVVLAAVKPSPALLLNALQAGAVDVIGVPLNPKAVVAAADRALERKNLWEGWLKRETGRLTGPLAQRLSEMEAILRQVDDGVLVLDKQYRILMVNRALRQSFGLGADDVAGKAVEEVIANPGLLESLRDQGEVGDRHEVQNQAGRIFHVRASHIPEVGTVAILHDISYLKELDKLKGDFVNTVSHDLRSPLTAILGYVELIERAGKVNPQQAEFIRRVKGSVHATTNLIDDLLKLGRVEVGALDELTPVDMRLLVANAMAGSQPKIQEKDQTLRMRRGRSLPPVLGSRSQLSQLVDNLLGNAVKYTQPGGKIFVTLEEEQNQLIVRVADNGPGIPLEEQGRIFEKFYRASNVEGAIPGTGLGLAIVKTIVENHRGRIWVDSKPGEGAMFTVVLPIQDQDRKGKPIQRATQKMARSKAK